MYAVDLQEKEETRSQAVVLPDTSHTPGTWYVNESFPYMHCIKGLHNEPLLAQQRPCGTQAGGLRGPSPVSPHEIQLVTLPLAPNRLQSKSSATTKFKKGSYFYSWEGLISPSFPNTPKGPLLNREPKGNGTNYTKQSVPSQDTTAPS